MKPQLCPCGSSYHPRVGRALVIHCNPAAARTEPLRRFDPAELATAWIAELRAGRAAHG